MLALAEEKKSVKKNVYFFKMTVKFNLNNKIFQFCFNIQKEKKK